MKKSQRKAGVILSYLGQAIQILSGLLFTPIMLRLLGQNEYGLYQLVFSMVSYLGLLSLGFGSAYMRYYSRYKARDDNEEIARLNGMFLTIFLVISSICIACGIVLIANIDIVFGTGLTSSEYSKAKILLALMIVNMAITFPSSVFESITTAHEQFIFQKLLVILQNLFNPFITLPLLLMGYGSVGMTLISLLLTISKLIINMWYCFRKLQSRFLFNGFKFNLLKEMWIFTFFIFLNQITDQISWNLDKFLLGRLSGTAAVAVYGVGSQINQMYMQFSSSISNIFIPEVNKIVAESNDNTKLTKIFTMVGRIQFIFLSLILTGFIFFGQSFMKLWAGKQYGDSFFVAMILILPATISLCQNLGIEIQRAKNKHMTRSVVYLGIAIINIGISIPLISIYGPIGAAIGTGVASTLGSIIFMNIYYHTRVGLDMIFYWKEISYILPALIPCIIVGIFVDLFIIIQGWLILLILILAYCIIFILSMWFIGMNESEKLMLKPIIKHIIRRNIHD